MYMEKIGNPDYALNYKQNKHYCDPTDLICHIILSYSHEMMSLLRQLGRRQTAQGVQSPYLQEGDQEVVRDECRLIIMDRPSRHQMTTLLKE